MCSFFAYQLYFSKGVKKKRRRGRGGVKEGRKGKEMGGVGEGEEEEEAKKERKKRIGTPQPVTDLPTQVMIRGPCPFGSP